MASLCHNVFMNEPTYEEKVETLKSKVVKLSKSVKEKNMTIDRILKLEKKINEYKTIHDDLLNDLEVEHFLEFGPGRIDPEYDNKL
jgi:hypothetical protein